MPVPLCDLPAERRFIASVARAALERKRDVARRCVALVAAQEIHKFAREPSSLITSAIETKTSSIPAGAAPANGADCSGCSTPSDCGSGASTPAVLSRSNTDLSTRTDSEGGCSQDGTLVLEAAAKTTAPPTEAPPALSEPGSPSPAINIPLAAISPAPASSFRPRSLLTASLMRATPSTTAAGFKFHSAPAAVTAAPAARTTGPSPCSATAAWPAVPLSVSPGCSAPPASSSSACIYYPPEPQSYSVRHTVLDFVWHRYQDCAQQPAIPFGPFHAEYQAAQQVAELYGAVVQ
ncbi:hypothetical protein HXX76_000451 [Chlamydomonas incerta]|uniref:Uncharacterized protein n=1 Tax=Chlamydomonas incerta TaxID=51695 RepID=A0A835WEB4_CHLIN|nr:hypothetical protein HXX76_000451 [Chlamydomonas incerta]|eukprot:KAG2445847.1 hypothetical protein HXX76_000451 [Chlamydomonas incerta]